MNIILKTDDFWGAKTLQRESWQKYFNIIIKYKVPISLGCVGQGFENINQEEIEILKEMIYNKVIEPFNHSYYHMLKESISEFNGTLPDYQIDSFYKTQKIIKQKLDYTISCFGSVANAWDNHTIQMISWASEIKYVYAYQFSHNYSLIQNKILPKITLPLNGYRFLESNEIPNRAVTAYRFKMLFPLLKDEAVVIFQLHPSSWKSNDLEDFDEIINYLLTNKHLIITPNQL